MIIKTADRLPQALKKSHFKRKEDPSKKRSLAVDHNHSTGKVRGILCYNCNRLLHAFDNLDLYNSIMLYLSKHKG